MYKKLLTLLFLLFLVLTTSGCVKYTSLMEIDSHDNVKFLQTGLFDLQAIKAKLEDVEYNLSDSSAYKDYTKDLYTKGYIYDEYKDFPYEGFKYLKKFKIKPFQVEPLPKGFSLYPEEGVLISVKKTPFKKTYTIHLKHELSQANVDVPIKNEQINYDENNPSSYMEEQNIISPIDEALSANDTEMKMVIKIPTKKVIEHNADNVIDTKTYEWNLAKKEPVEIKLIFEKINYLSYIFLFFLIFGTLWFVLTHEKYKPLKEDDYIPEIEHELDKNTNKD